MHPHPEGFVLILFGASGDLTCRKLVPALFNLFRQGHLPAHFLIIGFARSDMDSEAYRQLLARSMPQAQAATSPWHRFLQHVVYMRGNYQDINAYRCLAQRVAEFEQARHITCLHLLYLATPPAVFALIGEALGRYQAGPFRTQPNVRVAIEKPFGHDSRSARALNRCFLQTFHEQQIYRIDHYLGKETVQNILFLRFANGIFEPLWNRNYIDHLQFTVAEDLVLEGRVGYYDTAGALRDIMQNHILQLLCLATMEPPTSLDAEAIRDQKVNVLKSIRQPAPGAILGHTARGQYTAGTIRGRPIVGYLAEPEIPETSKTETYAAWKLSIDNWRWHGVPVYLRSGKGLQRKVTEIVIRFRQAPHMLFADKTNLARHVASPHNILRLRLQPNEGIALDIGVKRPGPSPQIAPVQLDFSYQEAFGSDLLDAYERLLQDLIAGDRTLFTRADEVDIAWEHITGVLEAWAEENRQPGFALPQYAPGSWGPVTGEQLIAGDGYRWQTR